MRTQTAPLFSWNLLLLITVLMIPSFATALELQLPDTHPGLQSVKPGGPLAKLDGALLKVYQEYTLHRRIAPDTPFKPRNLFLRLSKGHILVDARTDTDGELLLSRMNQLGLHKGSHFRGTVSGWLPIGVIRKAAELDSLQVLSASIPMTNAGDVMSQGDEAQRSYEARLDGLSGAGVKVGVLSDSYDHQNGAADDISSGDLPDNDELLGSLEVEVLDDSANCGDFISPQPCSDEGRAMLQIVHDVAPGANLAFHTAFNGFAGFANGIVSLADAGAQVIVDDVIYLGEPMFMDGIIAQAVDEVKDREVGVAYFSAAGNQARDSYEHEFANSGEMLYIDLGTLVPAGYMHDFDPEPNIIDTMQEHTIPAGQCAIFSVQWDSPFGSVAAGTGTQNDLDVWLVDDTGLLIVAYDAHENIPTGEPVEIMQFCNDGLWVPQYPPEFNLIIALWEGAEPGLLKTVLFGSASINEHATDSGTLYGHANAAGAEAVGAAYYEDTPAFGTTPPQLEYFSSAGGTPILFHVDGTPLADPEVRMKPEIVAPDGVNTTFFYPTSDRNGDTIPDFSGTSAAAPHAAGVAALMFEANPVATPDVIQAALESTAIDMTEEPGFDYDSGYGLIQADHAVAAIDATNIAPNADFTWSANNLDVQFTDLSNDSDGLVSEWNWNFGDGNVFNEQNPAHTYAAAGTYPVTLTVTDGDGDSDSITKSVTVPESLSCNNDGICDTGEDCNNCPNDCISGTGITGECGNGVCEPNAGEDCYSCPNDCAGSQVGKPSNRFCCGATEGCGDDRCTSEGYSCDSSPVSFCCGDLICEGNEDYITCAIDCGSPTCSSRGESCTDDNECCSGDCHDRKLTCK